MIHLQSLKLPGVGKERTKWTRLKINLLFWKHGNTVTGIFLRALYEFSFPFLGLLVFCRWKSRRIVLELNVHLNSSFFVSHC